jgi:hypothetical protein
MAEVNRHGAEAMGFDQNKTVHHFRLLKNGGTVSVQARDAKDAASIGQIQHHLRMQAGEFARGNFAAPEHTHGQIPPGVPAMQQLKGKIQYRFRRTAEGGTLIISSSDAAAVEAIHDFLKFQIQDHQTEDPVAVQ